MSQSIISRHRHPKHRGDPASNPHTGPRSIAGRADEPATPEAAELEAAMAGYQRHSGRQFPTGSEGLEVLRGLGYAKPDARPTPPSAAPGTARLRARIRRDGPVVGPIAAILARHGGVGVDPEADRIYAFPSEAACEAALMRVRSIHGWTSVEPDY